MDPNLMQTPGLLAFALYVAVVAVVLCAVSTAVRVLYVSRGARSDWVDEHHGRGSIEDNWGLDGWDT